MRRFVLLALLTATLVHAQETYVLGPDSKPQAGVPQGSVTKYELKPGRLYPGTPHTYSVYVPAQYDAAKPTPFMIFLDGSGFLTDKVQAPIVFDNLIAKHELHRSSVSLSIREFCPHSLTRRKIASSGSLSTIR
jgi:hypothetical protein